MSSTSPNDPYFTAIHEAGHFVAMHILKWKVKFYYVTIMPRRGSWGAVSFVGGPIASRPFPEHAKVCLAGLAAEVFARAIMGQVLTTDANNDPSRAQEILGTRLAELINANEIGAAQDIKLLKEHPGLADGQELGDIGAALVFVLENWNLIESLAADLKLRKTFYGCESRLVAMLLDSDNQHLHDFMERYLDERKDPTPPPQFLVGVDEDHPRGDWFEDPLEYYHRKAAAGFDDPAIATIFAGVVGEIKELFERQQEGYDGFFQAIG